MYKSIFGKKYTDCTFAMKVKLWPESLGQFKKKGIRTFA